MVTAAGGATGHMGVQLALLAGCHVVAVCGSAAKAQRLRDLGASRIINYQEEVRDRPTTQTSLHEMSHAQTQHLSTRQEASI